LWRSKSTEKVSVNTILTAVAIVQAFIPRRRNGKREIAYKVIGDADKRRHYDRECDKIGTL